MELTIFETFAVAVLAILVASIVSNFRTYPKLLPPGPRSRLWGSKKAPALPPYKLFSALHKQYGSIISFYQGSTPVVVLGTLNAATDLLDKRGSIYSSRPRNIMAGEILSGGMRGLGMPYNTRWRNWRSLMHAGMGIEASQGYKSLQDAESKILLRDLLEETDSSRYPAHLVGGFAISIVIFVAYGRRVESLYDPVVVANQKTDECFIKLITPGKYIVESWPILLKLPLFLQWFRHEAEAQRARDTELYMGLMNAVRQQVNVGIAQPSTARRGLEKQADFGLTDVELAFALSAPFSAGVGTTLAVLDVFFLAMLHYPDVMKKAQNEIDSIVGPYRLPDFEDADALPYITAMIKETLRWKPIAPLAVPHSSIDDNMYEDMYIPKGSTVFVNVAEMSRDEAVFSSPDEFKPERYLDTDSSKSHSAQSTFFFGFGRRICPGMHVAQNSLFIAIARILWAFDINAPIDKNGERVLPAPDGFIGGLVIRPRPFSYLLSVRREQEVRSYITSAHKLAQEEVSAWM